MEVKVILFDFKNVKKVKIQIWQCEFCESVSFNIFTNIRDGFTSSNCFQCESENAKKVLDKIISIEDLQKSINF